MHDDDICNSEWQNSIIIIQRTGLGIILQSQGTNINHHAAKSDLQHRLHAVLVCPELARHSSIVHCTKLSKLCLN